MKSHQKIALFLSNMVAMASSSSLRGGNTRIIGGEEATRGEYSYIVSLSDHVGHFCGGSLLSRDVILSAAHCQGGEYSAIVGRHALNGTDGEVIAMKSEVPHPEYNPVLTDNDFMLVFLETPVSGAIEYVKLYSDATGPKIDTPATVMGWGDMDVADDVSTMSNVLLEVEVNVISNEECEASEGTVGGWEESYNGQITDNMLCARDFGEDACQGDSGGPLVVKGSDEHVQIGVVSWGIGCAHENFPGVYARVSSAYQWIRETVCRKSSFPPTEFDCDNIEYSPTQAPVVSPPSTAWPTFTPTPAPNNV